MMGISYLFPKKLAGGDAQAPGPGGVGAGFRTLLQLIPLVRRRLRAPSAGSSARFRRMWSETCSP